MKGPIPDKEFYINGSQSLFCTPPKHFLGQTSAKEPQKCV